MADRSKHGLLESFNYAINGIVWALRHQRNMQIHVGLATVVVVMAVVFAVPRGDLLLVFAAITFVIVAELINTAIEYTVDLVTKDESPMAKIAKDVAAGAVFIASLNALVVAYLVFYDHIVSWPYRFFYRLRVSPVDITVVALVLVAIIVVVVKAAVGQGTFLRGGWPSGHAAVAVAAWVAVTGLAARGDSRSHAGHRRDGGRAGGVQAVLTAAGPIGGVLVRRQHQRSHICGRD